MASRLDRGQGHARSHELFKNYGAVRIRIQLERELSKPQKTRVQFFGARPWQHLKPLASEDTRLQDDNETAQRMAKPTVSSGSSSSDPTCRQVATAYMATHPAPAPMRGYGQVQPFAAAMRERRIHMPEENNPTPTALQASGTIPGVVSRLVDNWGTSSKHHAALEEPLQRCRCELEELHKARKERHGNDPRKNRKPLATEDTRKQVEILEARMATLQDRIDTMTPLLPHTPLSPTVTPQGQIPKGYPEVWGDRSTWKEGTWPEQVLNSNPDPNYNPDPNPETVMTCCTCTSRHVSTQPASVQIRVQSPVQVIDDIEDLFQGEVGYEVQTFAEILSISTGHAGQHSP